MNQTSLNRLEYPRDHHQFIITRDDLLTDGPEEVILIISLNAENRDEISALDNKSSIWGA